MNARQQRKHDNKVAIKQRRAQKYANRVVDRLAKKAAASAQRKAIAEDKQREEDLNSIVRKITRRRHDQPVHFTASKTQRKINSGFKQRIKGVQRIMRFVRTGELV